MRFLLGDVAYDDPALRRPARPTADAGHAPARPPYPHTDAGVGGPARLPPLRSQAIENFNGQFKGIFDCTDRSPPAA